MVVTRWKDSRVLQTISIVMVKGTTTVQQWTGWEVQSVECPYNIHTYQDGMGADTLQEVVQRGYFGITGFSMLQSFSSWNLSADELAAL
eukprot:6590120-Ditylum_brightwellii.AAC.1